MGESGVLFSVQGGSFDNCFFKLVDDFILTKCANMYLGNDTDNKLKLSIFENMVNFYYFFSSSLNEMEKITKNRPDLNSNKFLELKTIYNFKLSGELVAKNQNSDASRMISEKPSMWNGLFSAFVSKANQVIKKITNSYKLDNPVAFKKFIDKINAQLNVKDLNSKNDSQKSFLSLDFVLSAAVNYCNGKIFADISSYLCDEYKDYKEKIQFSSISEQLKSLRNGCSVFVLPKNVILNNVLSSNIAEKYTVNDLLLMRDIIGKENSMPLTNIISAIVSHPYKRKTIKIENETNFANIITLMIDENKKAGGNITYVLNAVCNIIQDIELPGDKPIIIENLKGLSELLDKTSHFRFLSVLVEKFQFDSKTKVDLCLQTNRMIETLYKQYEKFKDVENRDVENGTDYTLFERTVKCFYNNFLSPIANGSNSEEIICYKNFSALMEITSFIDNQNSNRPTNNLNDENKSVPKDIKKCDMHQINYKLCCWKLKSDEAKENQLSISNVYSWYKYFVENKVNGIDKIQWYELFMSCKNLSIENNNTNYDTDSIARFLVEIFKNKPKQKTDSVAKHSFFKISQNKADTKTSDDTVASANVDWAFSFFKSYIRHCFEGEDPQKFKMDMDLLYQLGEAIASLYAEKYSDCEIYITSYLENSIETLSTVGGNSNLIKSNFTAYNYVYVKLFLIMKKYFLKLDSTKKLDLFNPGDKITVLNNNPKCNSVKVLKEQKNILGKSNKLRDYMLRLNQIKQRYHCEIPIKNELGENIEQKLDYFNDDLKRLEQENQSLFIEWFESNNDKVKKQLENFVTRHISFKIAQEEFCTVNSGQKNNLNVDKISSLMTYLTREFYKIFPIEYNAIKAYRTRCQNVFDSFFDIVFKNKSFRSKDASTKQKETKEQYWNYFQKLACIDCFEPEKLAKILEERQHAASLIGEKMNADINKIIYIANLQNNNKQNYIGCSDICFYLKPSNDKKLNSNINMLAQNIANCIVFKDNDEPKKLFQKIQTMYGKYDDNNENKKELKAKISLDDVFEIIKVMLFDKKIIPELIDILMDNDLFAEKSLSSVNLEIMAKVVEYKNKDLYENKDLDTKERQAKENVNLKSFIGLINCEKVDLSIFFDCVSVFYCKGINKNENVRGRFTAQEIPEIIGEFYNYCDNWFELCEFIKYNWNGIGEISFDKGNSEQFWNSDSKNIVVATSEFLKSLIYPTQVLYKKIVEEGSTKENSLLQQTFIAGIKSTHNYLESLSSKTRDIIEGKKDEDKKDKDEDNVSNIFADYIKILSNCTQKKDILKSENYTEILNVIADCLQKTNTNFNKCSLSYADLKRVLEKAKDIKFPVYKLGKLVNLLKEDEAADFSLLTYFIDNNTKNNEEYKSSIESLVSDYLRILKPSSLNRDQFGKLRNTLTELGIELEPNEFIKYLQLANFPLVSNKNNPEEKKFDLFKECLSLLCIPEDTKFDDGQLFLIVECCRDKTQKNNVSDPDCIIFDQTAILIQLKQTYKKDFDVAVNGTSAIFSISKTMANIISENSDDNLAKIKNVLTQLKNSKVYVYTSQLKTIFEYCNFAEKKFYISDDIKQNIEKSNLELLVSCMDVLSDSESKKNSLYQTFSKEVVKFLKNYFTSAQMGRDKMLELLNLALSGYEGNNQNKKTLVLNLLILFWNPEYDYEIIKADELKDENQKNNVGLGDNFQRDIAVVYIVKCLHNILETVTEKKISAEEYKNIAKGISSLQNQITAYNETNQKITKKDIESEYKRIVDDNNKRIVDDNNNRIDSRNLDNIKSGILDFLIPEEENKNQQNENQFDNKKIMILLALFNTMNVPSKDEPNYSYSTIFQKVLDSGVLWLENNQIEKKKCNLKELRFVFDKILERHGNLNGQNILFIPFDDNGQKLFDDVLNCLDDDNVHHNEIFGFLREYFVPADPIDSQSKKTNLSKQFLRCVKNIFGIFSNNKQDYLNDTDFKSKLKQEKENSNQEFQLSPNNVKNIIQKSKNRFMSYDDQPESTKKFLDMYLQRNEKYLQENKKISNDEIISFIEKTSFNNLDSFENFMKDYSECNKLFGDNDLSKIKGSIRKIKDGQDGQIELCIAGLVFMHKIKIGAYKTEEGKTELFVLGNTMKEYEAQGNNLLEYIKDKYDRCYKSKCDKKKKTREIYELLKLVFGEKQKYDMDTYLAVISLILVLFLILYSSLTIHSLFICALGIAMFFISVNNLYKSLKFNREKRYYEGRITSFDQTKLYVQQNQMQINSGASVSYRNQNDLNNIGKQKIIPSQLINNQLINKSQQI